MDMSSSDDDVAEIKPPSTQLVPVQKSPDLKKQTPPKSVPFDPENDEVVLNFIEFDSNYDFESVFLQSQSSDPDSKLFARDYKRLKAFKIENCVFSDLA